MTDEPNKPSDGLPPQQAGPMYGIRSTGDAAAREAMRQAINGQRRPAHYGPEGESLRHPLDGMTFGSFRR
jgi:hypothetical protein